MKKLIIRWTFGETNARALSSQALDMLDLSVKFGSLCFNKMFNDVAFLICYNNLSDCVLRVLIKIADKNNITAMDVSNDLPEPFRNKEVKNSWWKYAPLRLDKSAYEIIMDNDLILWNIPKTLIKAITNNTLVALTDPAGKYYGDYRKQVENIDKKLQLNAGLVGLPPGFIIDPLEDYKVPLKDFFHSEQGYTALKFAEYKGSKLLIGLNEIHQTNINPIDSHKLISEYDGGHFCGCSYGHVDHWDRYYSIELKKFYIRCIGGCKNEL
jgi:hypothetical protein